MSNSKLRQRQSPSTTPKVPSNGFEGNGACSPGAMGPASSPRFRVHILAISAVLSVTVLLYLRSFIFHPPTLAYILCSPPGTARIYTVDDNNTKVECLVVKDEHIIDAGAFVDVKQRYAFDLIRIKQNATVVPGLTDSHIHALEYGAQKQMPMENTKDVDATVDRVATYIKSHPAIHRNTSYFVEGWGWDHTKWHTERFPTYTDLEKNPTVSGRPIVLQSKDGHALWVSEKIIRAMLPLPDHVEGGFIVRDKDGRPTGVFLDKAQDLVPKEPATEEHLLARWAATVKDAHSFGLTSIHDAGFSPVSLKFFNRQAESGNLPLRVYGMRYFDESKPYWGDSAEKLISVGNHRLTSRSVKIFGDGALRSGGAALYEPYTDNPETRGFMRISAEDLNDVIPRFMRDGWQVNVHAIGDRAHGIILDAFEHALASANVTALRPRLEHAQIMTRADMARLGKLGVIASVQPTHATSDMWYAEERLGPERVKGLYAFRSIIDEGARITLGSDSPVEGMNPLSTFYAAITRLSADEKSPHGPGGWFPEQKMTRLEALRGITIDPAYASFTEDILGSIVPGKRADYVVLSQDIMEIPANEILNTKVLATVIDGEIVYGKL